MKVSIVIPLYNKAPYLRRTLDSVVAQTFTDYEVIVVDDGSTDGGGDILAEYADRGFRLIKQANAGPGRARNRGLAEAQGEYVSFLDADDEWMPDFLKDNVALLDGSPPEVACVTACYVEEPRGVAMTDFWAAKGVVDGIYTLEPTTSPVFVVDLLAFMCPWSTLVRTEIVRKHGGFYDKFRCLYAEDSYLWLRVMLNHPVRVNSKPLVRFHREASALSANLKGARPIEPKLTDPDDLTADCPERLRPLLDAVLAIRATKTACMLAFWGRSAEARNLLKRFGCRSDARSWLSIAARLGASPIGPPVSALARFAASTLRKPAPTK